MTLSVKLAIISQTLLYQQETYCPVTLKNTGLGPVELSLPPMDITLPIVHLLNIKTGAEGEYRRQPPADAGGHEPGKLAAGKSVETGFRLLDVVGKIEPGEYDIWVEWVYDRGKGRAKSQIVRIKVLPTTPKNLYTVNAIGGGGGAKYGVWVNLAVNSPQIVRTEFNLRPGLPVSSVLPIAECGPMSKPILSAPAYGDFLKSHWIAWTDGGSLCYLHADSELGITKVQRVKMLAEDAKIITPIYNDPVTDLKVRPAGAVLLCFGLPGASQFSLQTIELTAKGATLGAPATIQGLPPVWMANQFRSEGQRVVTYLQEEGQKLALYSRPWLGRGQADAPSPSLGEWTGRHLAAAADIAKGNEIHGALLMWKAAMEGTWQLVLVSWTISSKNELKEVKEHVVGWPPGNEVLQARISLRDDGRPAALLCDRDGKWHVYDSAGELKPAPPEFEKTKLPIELGFLYGDQEPLLICGTLENGFRTIRLDGSPLPMPLPKK